MSPNTVAAAVLVLLLPLGAVGQTALQDTRIETREETLRLQREARREALEPYRTSRIESIVRAYEGRLLHRDTFDESWWGLHALLGGMPSGSGLALGAGYHIGDRRDWVRFEMDGRISARDFRQVDARLLLPTLVKASPIGWLVSARYGDYPAISSYGLGNDTARGDRSDFALTDRRLLLESHFEPHRWVRFKADVGLEDVELSESSGMPLKSDDVLPGLGSNSAFFIYGGGVILRFLDDDGALPSAGVSLAANYRRFDGRDDNAFSFERYDGELQIHVPLGPRSRRLAFRARTSHSRPMSGAEVPFFLMETLGGGSTLRGFDQWRFRDTRNVLLSLEYRWEVWRHLDFALFSDAGQVFRELDELAIRELHASYGFGIRAHAGSRTVLRVDVARSNESMKVHFSAGPSF